MNTNTVESIGDSAFLGCNALTILVEDLHVVYSFSNFGNPSNCPVWDARKATFDKLDDVVLNREDSMS